MEAKPLNPLLAALSGDFVPPESFWRSLHYYHLYRFVVACLFVLAAAYPGASLPFGSENIALARAVSQVYLLVAILVPLVLLWWRPSFNLLLTAEVFVDIALLTLLMATSGGSRSGLSYLLLVVIAAAGLLGQGRLTLFYASLATFGVFLEQGHRVLKDEAQLADFSYAGIISIGFFATAVTARLLARRVVANEALAQKRGRELTNQLEINQRVIRDMQDGILVTDGEGRVNQFNPRAATLWECNPGGFPRLEDFSTELAARYSGWRIAMTEATEVMRSPRSGKMLRVRYVPAAESTPSANALLYIEDMEHIQAQAQQIKLVALGRLTANMAHEIRNPLAAISHAAELLSESSEASAQERLIRIIGDNAQRLNRLVTDVMELGRRDRTQPEVVKLRELITSVVDGLIPAEGNVRAVVAIDVPESLRMLFDRSHFYRVLTNLIENALHFSNRGVGSIQLHARQESTSGLVKLTVKDDGPGVALDLKDNLFEPFFTTRKGGTGLGLYIARELCQANGARLELMATDNGSCFRISGKGE